MVRSALGDRDAPLNRSSGQFDAENRQNKGHFPGIAPEHIKIDVLAIGVQSEVVKPEILNTGQNGAPGGA